MWQNSKNAAAVAVITLLIWWSADRGVTDADHFAVRLAVRAADPGVLAALESPNPAEVTATLSGTRGRLEALRSRLRREPALAFEYVLSVDASAPGRRPLSTRTMLAGSAAFGELGLDVVDVQPPEAVVTLDRFVSERLRIEPDFGAIGVENVACQPATVELRRVPARLLASRYGDRVLRPSAEPALRQWLTAHPEETTFEIDVTLSVPDAPHVIEFVPSPHVKVVGRFVSPLATVRRGPVQVVFAIPPDVQRQYEVRPAEKSNLRPDVWIRGPKAQVEQIAPQEISLYVEVRASDVAGTTKVVQRAPRVILPPGVELAREPEEIEFELVERAPAEPPGA